MERFLIVVYFHEITLKGRNRAWFSRHIRDNLVHVLKGTGATLASENPAMAVFALNGADLDEVSSRLATTPGVEKFYLAHRVPKDLDAVEAALRDLLADRQFESFRISARRNDKRFPVPSMEIKRRVGAFVQALTGARVDLERPELDISIYVLPDHIYVYFEAFDGPGGMPVGVGGRVVALLSGGIDSPVATWRMLRRGCRALLVHFHSYPLVSSASKEKAEELAEVLARWQMRSTLALVPFGPTQQEMLLTTPPGYRVVLYRRFMLRIAERIAQRRGAGALVTGESLGQVSSQTLENIQVINSVATLPVLRPLIGMDKAEIVAQAKALGTYDISIIPDEDCCTLFTPRHPTTRSSLATAERLERDLDVEGLVERAVEATEYKDFTWP